MLCLLLLDLRQDFLGCAQFAGLAQRFGSVRPAAARPAAGSGLQFPDLALEIAAR